MSESAIALIVGKRRTVGGGKDWTNDMLDAAVPVERRHGLERTLESLLSAYATVVMTLEAIGCPGLRQQAAEMMAVMLRRLRAGRDDSAPDAEMVERLAAATEEAYAAADRHMRRGQCDFLFWIAQAYGQADDCCSFGEVDDGRMADYRAAMAELAALALAQVALADEALAAGQVAHA